MLKRQHSGISPTDISIAPYTIQYVYPPHYCTSCCYSCYQRTCKSSEEPKRKRRGRMGKGKCVHTSLWMSVCVCMCLFLPPKDSEVICKNNTQPNTVQDMKKESGSVWILQSVNLGTKRNDKDQSCYFVCVLFNKWIIGQPRCLSGLAPAFCQGLILETWDRVPHWASCMEPVSPSPYVSASLMNK